MAESRLPEIVDAFGDLLFDLSHGLVPGAAQGGETFRAAVKAVTKGSPPHKYEQFRRAAALAVALPVILDHARRAPRPAPLEENFGSAFEHLTAEGRALLLLHDKHEIPLAELGSAWSEPESTLKIRRQQALRTLSERVWGDDRESGPPATAAEFGCFEVQNRLSDALDGSVAPADREAFRTHVSACRSCATRLERSRSLIDSIRALPRVTIPEAIRAAPLSNPRDAEGSPGGPERGARAKWNRTPWFIRSGVEGAAIAAVILAVVAAVPKLRSHYERALQRRIESYDLATDLKLEDAYLPGTLPSQDDLGEEEISTPLIKDEPSLAGDTSILGDEEENAEVKVGESQIWRLYLKTDSPTESRTKVISILTSLGVPPDHPGMEGVRAPGGIQFNMLIPQSIVPELKRQVQALAVPVAGAPTDAVSKKTFTWFRNKSRRKIPAGESRVIIWLSQI